jgi:PAS domain S-box-containing protein
MVTKSGRVFPAYERADAIKDNDGKLIGLIGIITDISERKKSEEETRKSEALLSQSQHIGKLGSWHFDLMTGQTTWSDETYRVYGVSRDTFTPSVESLLGLIHPDDRQAMQAWIADCVADKKPPPLEFRINPPDGTLRWLYGYGGLTHDAATGHRVLAGIAQDITERKQAEADRARLEAQLRESQKMEALGTMAGGVAHDFNNALAMIIGNVELARQDVGPDHPALVSLDEIGKASRRARDLVQQILSFGRRQRLDRKATTLALVVVETARLARATLPAMVALDVNCEPDAPAVLADATQIKQILLNLCGNAIQAIQDQGSTGKVEIDLRSHVQSEGGRLPT